MVSYVVLLGVDRAARVTGRRMTMRVRESDPLSASVKAERIANKWVDDPEVEYTHAMRVKPVFRPVPLAAAMAPVMPMANTLSVAA